MENIKNDFKENFNIAVKSFNGKDYKTFFLHIRLAIEGLGKLSIYDILGESAAKDYINGVFSIEWHPEKTAYEKEDKPTDAVTGSSLVKYVPMVFLYKHPNVIKPSGVPKSVKKQFKSGLERNTDMLVYFYSIASTYHHTGDLRFNAATQASVGAALLMGYFDFLKTYEEKVLFLSSDNIDFLCSLDSFQFDNPKAVSEFQCMIDELSSDLAKKNIALMEAKKSLAEAKKRAAEAEKRAAEAEKRAAEGDARCESRQREIDEYQKQIDEYQKQIDEYQKQLAGRDAKGPVPMKGQVKQKFYGPAKGNDIDENSMDDDQLDLIERTNDESMLVAGCAGSGKSVIAMKKAEQLAAQGKDVILIAYTKSLNSYMGIGRPSESVKSYYYQQWLNMNKPASDYIIVDEIQDFTREQIKEFCAKARKCYFFFGDTAQSIYNKPGKPTMTIEQIAELTGLETLMLYNNYRLPRPIAKITQNHVGVNVLPYSDRVYQNRETESPRFIRTGTPDDELNLIVEIIQSHSNMSIGILFHENRSVLQLSEQLSNRGVLVEFKYNDNDTMQSFSTLDFKTLLPKVMTYHSAKGLQFDIVIIPQYKGAENPEKRKALYVAMTRTMHKLYVLYATSELLSPLKEVPSHLYLKSL